ncbi:MAG TPA: RecX family transcriptional regulator [Longilinea sp.]|nr:RecX family transcriptional regulator [Longilinea sp.]
MDHRITALKAQKRNPNRINVYLDGEFAFGLARIVAAWLQVGQTINDDKIHALQSQDANEVAYQKAIHFLSYRPRSEDEIRRKLNKDGFSEEISEAILERLREAGLVSDRNFARGWVESRNASKPRGRHALTAELHRKGISGEIIQETLAGTDDESDLAYRAGLRYANRLSQAEWDTFRTRLTAFLGRRGFSYGTITPQVRKIWNEIHGNQSENQTLNEEELDNYG